MVEISKKAQGVKFEQETKTPFNAEESTRIVGTLSRIQELFYENSDFKDGPKAGKVNSAQLKTGKIGISYEQADQDFSFSSSFKWSIYIGR